MAGKEKVHTQAERPPLLPGIYSPTHSHTLNPRISKSAPTLAQLAPFLFAASLCFCTTQFNNKSNRDVLDGFSFQPSVADLG